MEIKENSKNKYRNYAKTVRNGLNLVQISQKTCEIISNQEWFRFSENILTYYPFNNEIDLCGLFGHPEKKWYLPRIEFNPKSMTIHEYIPGETLVKNKWGVLEPSEIKEAVDLHKIDIALIPALMADKSGNRLGYGAGYYDRFISSLRKDCLKVVIVPQELFIEKLPADHWDIPVDRVATQDGLFRV